MGCLGLLRAVSGSASFLFRWWHLGTAMGDDWSLKAILSRIPRRLCHQTIDWQGHVVAERICCRRKKTNKQQKKITTSKEVMNQSWGRRIHRTCAWQMVTFYGACFHFFNFCVYAHVSLGTKVFQSGFFVQILTLFSTLHWCHNGSEFSPSFGKLARMNSLSRVWALPDLS